MCVQRDIKVHCAIISNLHQAEIENTYVQRTAACSGEQHWVLPDGTMISPLTPMPSGKQPDDMRTQVERYLDGVAKDEMCHHGITHKNHATDQAEMDEVRTRQGQGAGDNTQAGLEVHPLEDPANEQQDVDAVEGVVPGQLVDQVLQVGKGSLQLEEEDAALVQPQKGSFGLEIGVHIIPGVRDNIEKVRQGESMVWVRTARSGREG